MDLEYIALAYKEFGEGKVLIHTDRLDGYLTGHAANSNEFWRKVLEFISGMSTQDFIKIGFVCVGDINYVNSISGISQTIVSKINYSDIGYINLNDFSCLYFAQLPEKTNVSINDKIMQFVVGGNGLIIETPNRTGEYINILQPMDDVLCYSSMPAPAKKSYWYVDGKANYIYDPSVNMAFMSSMLKTDFTSGWHFLMGSTPVDVASEVIVENGQVVTNVLSNVALSGKSSSEFQVSFLSTMKNGVVTIK